MKSTRAARVGVRFGLGLLLGTSLARAEPVHTGIQDFRTLAPTDLEVGPVVMPGQVVYGASDGSWIRFKADSNWGWFSYRLTRVAAEPGGPSGRAELPPPLEVAPISGDVPWPEVNSVATRKRLWLEGEITAVQPGGAEAEGWFRFKGEKVRLQLELLDNRLEGPNPGPTLRHVPYGPDVHQTLDVYLVPSPRPTPVAVFIHGGAWIEGDKSEIDEYQPLLKAGITVVAVNYRFCPPENPDATTPAVAVPLRDAARAIQFIRSRAAEWRLRKARLGVWGGSAGAASSLWLATHPDLADPASADPVGRESSRPCCAVGVGAQTSLDPAQMRAWVGPGLTYGGHAFGIGPAGGAAASFEKFLTARPRLLPWIREYSPAALLRRDTPPVFLDYRDYTLVPNVPLDGYYAHSPGFGIGFYELARRLGQECYLRYRGREAEHYASWQAFMIAKLCE